ncbi:MAG: type II secretion system F family protein [Bacillota bacterium]|jgi:tight adherence protein C|nr:type II secretion system F family protein [Clostridia bacterium]
MLMVLIVLAFITGWTFVYGTYYILAYDRLLMEKRLKMIKTQSTLKVHRNEELQRPFMDRAVRPLLRWIYAVTRRFTPVKKRVDLEKKLVLAGRPLGLSSHEFISLYYAVAALLGLTGFLLALAGRLNIFSRLLCGLWGMIIGYFLVELYLKIKTKNRQEQILKKLPDVLDLLTVSVEAGLGFDAALSRVVQKIKGPISQEFSIALQEIKMGKQRKDALKDLGIRTGVEELNAFISAVIQADQLGVSIGNVLRVQSMQQRNTRRQRIEEKAMKAPIKMLLPMVFFIFPTVFIVILAPAVIQMIENLSK